MKNRLLTILTIAMLLAGCTKDPLEQEAGRAMLKVEVITPESAWGTRAAVALPAIEQCDTVYVDDDVFITAEVEDLAAALSRERAERALQFAADSLALLSSTSADIPATRGTPATTTSQIASLRMNMYVSGTGDFVATTPLKSSFTGTLNGGNYTLSPEYAWLESSTDKHSFLTFAPNASSPNGITMATDGRTVTYTVPTATANQPDLCWATPSLNKQNEPLQTVALSHALTAIGVGFKGYDVRIKSATIKGVMNTGTLDLQTGTWSAVGGSGDYTVGVSASYRTDTHTAGYTGATAANGYLMMIPQALSGTETLEIEYEGQNGQPSGTLTSIKLSEILTTWAAGKRIMYNIRLKTAPAVTSGDLTINDFRAGYTTSLPLSISAAADDNLTFTWGETWLKVHRGSALSGASVSGGAGSGWSTGVNGWGTSIWFFTIDDNPSTISARTATVTVTGIKSGTKTFKVTQIVQPKPTLSLSQTNPGVTIPAAGADYYVNVTSNSTWKAVGTNCTVTPTGSGNVNSFKITVQPNTGVQRTPQVVFETTNTTAGVTNAKATWSGTQAAFAPTISFTPAAPAYVSGTGGTYTVKVTSNTAWTVSGTTGMSFSRTTGGTVGTTTTTDVVITMTANPSTTADRALVATFSAGTASSKWNSTQGYINYVVINGLKWAVGNLVATGSAGAEAGLGGCRVGTPTDGGVYFQWGSLVGWSGGAANGNGTGMYPYRSSPVNTFLYVKPTGYAGSSSWDKNWSGSMTINASTGTGDPCTYYLGGSWRLPTKDEFQALVNKGAWRTSYNGIYGGWFGPYANNFTTSIFIPASDLVDAGICQRSAFISYSWSRTLERSGRAYWLVILQDQDWYGSVDIFYDLCTYGCTVRCVSN